MSMELNLELQSQWEMFPVQMLNRAEVFENITTSGGQNLEEDYLRIRAQLMQERFAAISVLARSKSGKGGLMMGFSRLFRQDEYLREWAEKLNIKVGVNSVPFALCAEAAKLPRVGLVPPEFASATFERNHLRAISRLQWNLIEQYVIPPKVSNPQELTEYLIAHQQAIVLLVEGSAVLTYPVTESVPVEVEGFDDLGNSTYYNVALDPRLRGLGYFYLIDREKRLAEDQDSSEFRINIHRETPDLKALYDNLTSIVVTLSSGEEVEFRDLPEAEQFRVAAIIKRSTASPGAISRNDQLQDLLIEQLYAKGQISSISDADYYEFLGQRLHLPEGHFNLLQNFWFAGNKSYDSDYLVNNVVVRTYPELLLP